MGLWAGTAVGSGLHLHSPSVGRKMAEGTGHQLHRASAIEALALQQEMFVLKRPGDRRAAVIKLTEGTLVIGRAPSCDIVVTDASVSRRHAELTVKGSLVSVCDLGSRNGTYVNEEEILSRNLKPGQCLRFGGVSFMIMRASGGDPATEDYETQSIEDALEPLRLRDLEALPLSPAQRRVLQLLLAGRSEKEAASELRLSRHTVHNHIRSIYRILGVHSRTELLTRFVPKLDGQTSLT